MPRTPPAPTALRQTDVSDCSDTDGRFSGQSDAADSDCNATGPTAPTSPTPTAAPVQILFASFALPLELPQKTQKEDTD